MAEIRPRPQVGFECYLVGAGSVALRCAEILLEAGHSLRAVGSFDRSLAQWAGQHGIPHFDSKAALQRELLGSPFDYLFSVNNPWIIPEEVIRAARSRAINLHDSPLPSYAGLHATSWALIHGETSHAISWHEVTPEIDAGRIGKQVPFELGPSDTALSVNARALDFAVKGFAELVAELEAGTDRWRDQPQVGGSYFGRGSRPEAAGVLAWDQPAEKLRDLVRALWFGPTTNPLGSAKVLLPTGVVTVGELRDRGPADAEPGTVCRVEDDGLWVAARDRVVELSSLSTLEGRALDAAAIRALGLAVGDRLPEFDAAERAALDSFNRAVCAHERDWVQRLATALPFAHPYDQGPRSGSAGDVVERVSLDRVKALGLAPDELLACVAAYCARLSGGESFDLGFLPAGMPAVAQELFVPVLPFRVAPGEDASAESFAGFRGRLATELARCRHGGLARDVLPRFPELRAMREFPRFPVALAWLRCPEDLRLEGSRIGLAIACYDDGSPPELIYRGGMESWQVAALVEQLSRLAEGWTAAPDLPLAALPLVGDAERRRILVDWNDSAKDYPADATAHGLFSAQAGLTPTNVAVSFGDQRLSYAELDARTNRLARGLRARGVRPGDLVALCVPRSVEMLVGLLGILKSGAAYVPIDPTYPSDRVSFLVEDSAASYVVTDSRLAVELFGDRDELICLDSDAERIAAQSSAEIDSGVGPDDLIYVIYTSGSTGKPKGVAIEHGALINHGWAIADNYRLDGSDRMLQSASISFDVAAEQIFPPLFCGAEVVIRPDDLLESFTRFDRFARDRRITAMILPTSFWHEWANRLKSSGAGVPEDLRALSVGTEKALGHRLDDWEALSPGQVSFFQGYGPTEATVTCTMYKHRSGEQFGSTGEIPIGGPLPNTELYVLDADMQPVPVGIPGELFVGGRGVARGYHRREQLTRERFVLNPFREGSGERLYRTGDLVRWLPDGQLIYVGRDDLQIKVRGMRVELGEIESELEAIDGVDEAIVQPVSSPSGQQQLFAYLVPESGVVLDLGALRSVIAERLPAHMVPAGFIPLDSLPLTPNHKVDRSALPIPTVTDDEAAFEAPADDLEVQIAALWADRLGVERVGRGSNFFDLGGDSLAAVSLLDEMGAATGIEIPLGQLFSSPTLAEFCEALRGGGAELTPAVIPLNRCAEGVPLFLICGIHLYRDLALRLQSCCPAFGVFLPVEAESFGETAEVVTKHSGLAVQSWAAGYIEAIRTQQPRGPYRLGGVSFGGILAYEIARQLQAAGEEIELLALFDATLPSGKRWSLRGWLKARLRSVRRGRGDAKLPGVDELQPRGRGGARVSGELPIAAGGPDRVDLLEKRRAEMYGAAMREYDREVRPYPGGALIFRASDREGMESCEIDPWLGWRRHISGEIVTQDVAGDHIGMLSEPFVTDLAGKLEPYLHSSR